MHGRWLSLRQRYLSMLLVLVAVIGLATAGQEVPAADAQQPNPTPAAQPAAAPEIKTQVMKNVDGVELRITMVPNNHPLHDTLVAQWRAEAARGLPSRGPQGRFALPESISDSTFSQLTDAGADADAAAPVDSSTCADSAAVPDESGDFVLGDVMDVDQSANYLQSPFIRDGATTNCQYGRAGNGIFNTLVGSGYVIWDYWRNEYFQSVQQNSVACGGPGVTGCTYHTQMNGGQDPLVAAYRFGVYWTQAARITNYWCS